MPGSGMLSALTRAVVLAAIGSPESAMNRSQDWWEQSLRDLRHARDALYDADFE
jgi:hypothetical protein